MSRALAFCATSFVLAALVGAACSASGEAEDFDTSSSSSGSGATGGEGGGGPGVCGECFGDSYTPCNPDGSAGTPVVCPEACSPGVGCTPCLAGANTCVGNEVHACGPDGTVGDLITTCDVASGQTCLDGECKSGCAVAEGQPSNVGCEFWAVDLDQQDGFNDPASMPWGVVLSNASDAIANVTIERNDGPPGGPLQTVVVAQTTIAAGALEKVILETRELDCGVKPNDYASPGTCLSSRAFRITASSPIVVYQFNVFENAYSNDASLLLPTNALGQVYRVINWSAGHPAKIGGFNILDRSYVTIVGTKENTSVTVKPSWRIKGNAPIAATDAGGTITVTLGPFDVLNLETDDATLAEAANAGVADLTGTTVQSSSRSRSSAVSRARPRRITSTSPRTRGGTRATRAASITSRSRCFPSSPSANGSW